MPDDYFDFIDDFQLNDQNASNNRDYYKFLNALSFRLSKPESLPSYPIIDRLENIAGMSHAFADAMLLAEVKDYFLSMSVRDYLRYDLGKADSLIQMLESMGINAFYLDAYKAVDALNTVAFQIPDSIEVSSLDNERIKLIDSIPSYTYLGIWSIGCKGCYIDFREKERIC